MVVSTAHQAVKKAYNQSAQGQALEKIRNQKKNKINNKIYNKINNKKTSDKLLTRTMTFMSKHAHKTGKPCWTQAQHDNNVKKHLGTRAARNTLNSKDVVMHVFAHGEDGLNKENRGWLNASTLTLFYGRRLQQHDLSCVH